ncbi:MAG: MBL fold metallo-hydrolase [Clostridia bacterium]|nr:MBL fold metallo-hydrolase [Clostridia bacterium]
MKLTVLGRHGPFPAPGGACSGYLIQAGDTALVLELGPGALSNLRRIYPNINVDGILLSHLHSDHMGDMLVLRYALPQLKIKTPLTVVAPETPETEYRTLASSGVFEMVSAKAGRKLRFGEVTVTLHGSSHPVETYAFDIEYRGKRIFYTGDTGMHTDLVNQCRGADILLADACFLNAEKPGEKAQHLTAGEAGQVAKAAGVGQLICTHVWGGREDTEQMLAEAREHFANCLIAEEMHEYHV